MKEWTAIRSLADDCSIIIKKPDKGFCIVVWDRNVVEEEKQLGDKYIYQNVNFSDRILRDVVDKSNKIFRSLTSQVKITEKNLTHFTYEYQKATNLGKMYLLPKRHKRLSNLLGRPVISNCGTPTEKVSEFLDFQLKRTMQSSKSYIKDSGDFIRKSKDIQYIPSIAILVTVDVVGLYPSIPHDSELKALINILDKRKNQDLLTADVIKMTEFVWRNNYFEFNGKIKQQISGTAIGTKCALTMLAYKWMNLKTSFSVYRMTNLWYGLGVSITFSLYGHMEKKNFTNLWKA